MFALSRNRLSMLSGQTRGRGRGRAKRGEGEWLSVVDKWGWGGCGCLEIDVLDLPSATLVTEIVYQYTIHIIFALAL